MHGAAKVAQSDVLGVSEGRDADVAVDGGRGDVQIGGGTQGRDGEGGDRGGGVGIVGAQGVEGGDAEGVLCGRAVSGRQEEHAQLLTMLPLWVPTTWWLS